MLLLHRVELHEVVKEMLPVNMDGLVELLLSQDLLLLLLDLLLKGPDVLFLLLHGVKQTSVCMCLSFLLFIMLCLHDSNLL